MSARDRVAEVREPGPSMGLGGFDSRSAAETARALLTDPVAAPAAAEAACQHPVSSCGDLADPQAVLPTESEEAEADLAGATAAGEGVVGHAGSPAASSSSGGPGMPSARASAEARGFSAEPATAGAPSGAGARPERQQTGFDKPPSHYDGGEQLEAIDAIWRNLRTLASDEAMVGFCVGNALKYESRAGRKTDGDLEKARWYWAFAAYVRGEGPDPRTARPGWVPHPDAPRPRSALVETPDGCFCSMCP